VIKFPPSIGEGKDESDLWDFSQLPFFKGDSKAEVYLGISS
jgi:hypothetical protein